MEQSVGCYAMALQGAGAAGAAPKLVVARLLHALSVAEGPALSAALADHAPPLPASTWLPWLPFLLSSLARPAEAPAAAAFLAKVAHAYPQALYYSLRSFLLEQQEQQDDPAESPAKRGAGERPVSSCQHAAALMATLRRTHGELVANLDELCGDVAACVCPTADEALLAALNALLQRLYATTDVLGPAPLPAWAAHSLAQTHAAFFAPTNRRHADALAPCAGAFARDFGTNAAPGGCAAVLTFDDAVRRLCKWRHVFTARVQRAPRRVALAQVPRGGGRCFFRALARSWRGALLVACASPSPCETLLPPAAPPSPALTRCAPNTAHPGRPGPRRAAPRRGRGLVGRAALRGSARPVRGLGRGGRGPAPAPARRPRALRLSGPRRLLARHRGERGANKTGDWFAAAFVV